MRSIRRGPGTGMAETSAREYPFDIIIYATGFDAISGAFDRIDIRGAGGVRLKDGTLREAELVVVATGYKNQQETVRAFLGDKVADRIGPVWGFDAGGELANMFKPTPQPGLWFLAGSLAQCRIYSRYLALQIKAREEGLVA